MNKIDNIKAKIEQIESLLAVIKNELETLSKEGKVKPKKSHTEEPLPSEEELRAEYEKLYEAFIFTNPKAIEEFIKGKSKNYLRVFCKANNLPVDTTKVSKEGIAKEVFQWMVQRKAITKKAT
jgi:hypothetical protein